MLLTLPLNFLLVSVLMYSFVGIAGAILSAPISLIARSKTPYLFASALTLQWTALGSSYYLARQSSLVYQARQTGRDAWTLDAYQKERASGIGGAVAGMAGGAIRGRLSNVAAGAVVLGTVGWGAQRFVGRWWDRRMGLESGEVSSDRRLMRASKAVTDTDDNVNVVQRMSKSRFNPMRRLTDEEYEGMLKEKLIKVEAELALVDEDIVKLELEKQKKTAVRE
jgi:hypothetical protein